MLMVLGHACSDNIPGMPLLMPFIVMFHMPIFFIASGYCFKEKYLSSLGKYLYNKVKGIWWPYVKWGLLFLLLHNVFFNLHLYNDEESILVIHNFSEEEQTIEINVESKDMDTTNKNNKLKGNTLTLQPLSSSVIYVK